MRAGHFVLVLASVILCHAYFGLDFSKTAMLLNGLCHFGRVWGGVQIERSSVEHLPQTP